MRSFIAFLILLLGGMLVTAPVLRAQDSVDIAAIAEVVSSRDPELLAAALETPMADDTLPAGFSLAELIDPESLSTSTASVTSGDVEGLVAPVMYSISYQPTDGESATPLASPVAGGPARIYNTGSMNYLIFDHDLSEETPEAFGQMLTDALGDQGAAAEVQEVALSNTTAYMASISTEINGVQVVMQWVAVPVGNVAVIGMAMSGGVSVDTEALQRDAQALTVAGVRHLGAVAEANEEPAG